MRSIPLRPARILLVVLLSMFSLLIACGGGTQAGPTVLTELPPVDPAALREFTAGVRLLSRGGRARQRRAVARFNRALEIDPNVWEAHYNLGVISREQNEVSAAAEHFEAARVIQPAAGEVLIALAEARYTLGDRDQASVLLQGYVQAHPEHLDARLALVSVERQRGDHDAALTHAREILTRRPSHVAALVEVGRIYRSRERYEVAELVFEKALEIDGESGSHRAEVHNEMGLLELSRGDTQEAFGHFAQALEADPRFAAAHLNQGSVLLHAGDYAGAEAQYRAALEQEPGHADARVALGMALRGQGSHRQARRQYQQVLDANPNHPAALFNMGVLLTEFLDQRPQAEPLFQTFLRVAPSSQEQEREMAQNYLRDLNSDMGPL